MQRASANITIDGCGYGVEEIEAPGAGPDGLPNGTTVRAKQLRFIVPGTQMGGAQLIVDVLFNPEAFDEFVKQMQGGRLQVATANDLARLRANGSP